MVGENLFPIFRMLVYGKNCTVVCVCVFVWGVGDGGRRFAERETQIYDGIS